MSHCAECGMTTAPNEYHPYAACLMYAQCGDEGTVRANLAAVVTHAVEHYVAAKAQQSQTEVAP